MLPIKLLLRAANRLQIAWLRRVKPDLRYCKNLLSSVDHCQHLLQSAQRRLGKARRFNLHMAMPQLQQEVLTRLRELQDELATRQSAICQAQDRWCQRFGPFWRNCSKSMVNLKVLRSTGKLKPSVPRPSRLPWKISTSAPSRYASSGSGLQVWSTTASFTVVAVTPNPSYANDNVTHPHVKNNKLCAGEAATPLKRALEQGRLADAFSLIRSVLSTYNPGSPHVLEEWIGSKCHDCDDSVGEEDLSFCEGCYEDYCSNCISYCAVCDCPRCTNCMVQCPVCHQECCQRCLAPSPSGSDCCTIFKRKCPSCLSVVATDDPQQGTGFCAMCRPLPSESSTPAPAEPTTDTLPDAPTQETLDATSLESDASSPSAA